eukprot:jgi/Mesvir1/3390/Mv05091-RA.1
MSSVVLLSSASPGLRSLGSKARPGALKARVQPLRPPNPRVIINRKSNGGRATTVCRAARGLDAEFLPKDIPKLFSEINCSFIKEMEDRLTWVPVETGLSENPILTSHVGPAEGCEASELPPVLLLHGFDSSCLEFRRLHPLLSQRGVATWAVDLLGWGFNLVEDGSINSFSPKAKREHLYEFWRQHIRRPMVLAGCSLGGAAAIDFARNHPDAVEKLILMDAQGYTEGVGPLATMPPFIAGLGVSVLKTKALRGMATKMAYVDKETFASEDAIKVTMLHTLMPGWRDAMLGFMSSGGYNVVNDIPKIQQPTLIIWGEQDEILDKSSFERFKKDIPHAQIRLLANCGHSPHVEKAADVADEILAFCAGRNV